MEEELALDPNMPPEFQQRVDPSSSEVTPPPGMRRPSAAGGIPVLPPTPVTPSETLRVTPQLPNQAPVRMPENNLPAPGALNPNLPPRATSPVPPTLTPTLTRPDGSQRTILEGDDNENESWRRGVQMEDRAFAGPPGSHKGKHETLDPPNIPTLETHPKYPMLQAIASERDQIKDPKAYKAADAILQRELKRVQTEVAVSEKRARSEYTAKQKDELRKIDEQNETLKSRDETAGSIDKYIGDLRTNLTTQLEDMDPNKKKEADYYLKTSPLVTLKPDQMRNIVRSMAALNPTLTTDQVTQYVMDFGQAVQSEDPSINGINGKGGAYYKPHKPDLNGNVMLEARDGNIIRLKKQDFAMIRAAREKSWDAGKKFHGDRDAKAQEKPWPEQLWNKVF